MKIEIERNGKHRNWTYVDFSNFIWEHEQGMSREDLVFELINVCARGQYMADRYEEYFTAYLNK